MIRSGSKLLKKGGSVRNLNKVGSKFRFVVEFETATKILATSDVVVTWERKGVVLSTEPVKVDRSSRAANFTGQKLSQVVTLFKPKKGGKGGVDFDEKAYTICVRLNNDKGKIIGKIHLNFAEYVSIPEFSKRMVAKLSHDGELILRVTSTYVGEAKKRKGSQGSSSVSSSTFGGDFRNEDARTATDSNDQSDLTDLELPNDFEEEPASRPNRPQKKDLVASDSRRDRERKRTDNRPSFSGAIAASPSRRRERERKKEKEVATSAGSVPLVPEISTREETISSRAKTANSSYTDTGSSVRGATVTRAEYEKVKRENRALIRKNNDLQAQNEELEEKLTSAGLNSNVGKVELLEGECERLTKEVRDLKSRLSREPVYADVVRELKDAKMALAILSTENAELKSRRR